VYRVTKTSMQRTRPSRLCRPTALVAAVALALLAMSFAVPSPAQAQNYGYGYGYDYDYGYGQKWWKPYNKKPKPQKARVNKQPAGAPAAKAASAQTIVSDKPLEGPLVLVVSLKNQRVTVYDKSGIVAVSPISSGRVGNPTPMGVFSILEKQKMHHSNLYDDAPMPNMQRLTWSGVALHAGVLPGYPASHGCIRLPHGFSQRLYNMTKTGARVIVTRDDAPVQSFSHQALFTTTAFDGDAKTGSAPSPNSNGKVADASGLTVATQTHVSDLVGVGSAQAATSTEPSKVSPYRQKWLAEMERRSQALKEAETSKAAAAAKIAETAKFADAAKSDLKTARIAADQTAQSLKRTEAARLASEKDLDAFAKPLLAEKPMTDDQIVASAMSEEALDAKLGELSASIAALTLDLEKTAESLKAAEQAAESAETERKIALNALSKVNDEVKSALESVNEAKRREAKRQLPVAIFISRQTKKLYVRQGYAPIFETPVEIAEPERPMGTHVFTALSAAPNAKTMNWSVASVSTSAPSDPKLTDKLRKKDAAKETLAKQVPQNPAGQTPAAALERIKIPEDAREQIADVMKPGSSLIVSDYGLSNETGLFTDFIIGLR
jgi:lipoprotein-anchoring transpeptidase ErfK/SrfK